MNNSKKSILKPVAIPLYRSKFFIAINISDKKLEEELKKHIESKKTINKLIKYSRVSSKEQAVTAYSSGYSVIRFTTLSDAQDINIIAHEAFHVTCNIARYVSLELSQESEEGFAYLLGYIVEQFQDIMALKVK